jgi:lysine-specific demethylase/histidyl-hydroxylase NO66
MCLLYSCLIIPVLLQAYEMIDAACDEMAKRFMSDRQPPALNKVELAQTNQADGEDEDTKEILPNTKCRLARPGIARLILEDDKSVVYHCADNARVFHDKPLNPLEFEMDDGAALEQLLTVVEPNWILVNDLFHDTIEDKVAIAQCLYDEGVLAIENEVESED